MKWFRHDSDASSQAKIEKLIMKYGSDGYAIYFYCLECIARPIDQHNLTFELEHDAETIGYKFKVDTLRVEEIMRYLVNVELFEFNHSSERITCMKLALALENSIVKNPQLIEMQKKLKGLTNKSPAKIAAKDMVNPGSSRIIPENPGQNRLEEIRRDKTTYVESGGVVVDKIPYEKIKQLYNETCTNFHKCFKLTATRKRDIRARWNEDDKHKNLAFWKSLFEYANSIPFLSGKGSRGWVASIDFIFKESKFTKLIENQYDNNNGATE